MKNKPNESILTTLFCQHCGTRLVWPAEEKRVEIKLMNPQWSDGTVHGLTFHLVCVKCRSKYSGWLPILQAPQWWEEVPNAWVSRSLGMEPPNYSSRTHRHDDLKKRKRTKASKLTPMQE